ncbi:MULTISPECIES: cytochrome c-type biogenesis CcmF C-terminal domain-containing protein [unclassified Pseudonocardia]|uniref:heme lyase CcmF/NrfE family subunit n=1 Tax=unclassified Pseudonocardia TaxID=2619320 RepID=UPI00095F7643|nr:MULTISPECIES: cytochrome c-type biogenesis CcmF C-terminal domain-containing protein [unclassified Pseudonocardia]MBN9098029.1 heme lyase CcmF/NrfE family subunit [Pseudonocardia sp.]OJY54427.1 MAG: cytochrome C biogenesis protein CcmF [Pseudonocardia sp. 73-21]
MTLAVPAAGWAGAMLGLAGSIVLAVLGLRAQRRPDSVRRRQLSAAVWCMVGGAALAMTALEVALLTDDFAVSYVAETHSRATPLLFTITSAWSALDGSLLLWALVLAGYTAVVLRGVPGTADRLGTGALGVLGLVGAFFFGLITMAANPFEILPDPPADGPGPNPILADHIMVAFHPPMLYLGFVGFTVPFAFAMSALLLREGGVDWLRRTRRANLVAWSFLTGGLVLGGWWSYEVLGWGGYWAWDPVENAALIPWLVATAFIHSAVVQVRRGMLQAWNFVLVLATFALTVLGTFLTRSSVVASVHSFSQSPVGPALLAFFGAVVVAGFTLIVLRAERVASLTRPESVASREGVFLVNNLLLSVFAFVVLLGTTYPILVEALTGSQVSVGRPFFDRMAVPLGFALLLAMGIGPVTPYRRATAAVMWTRLRHPVLGGAAAGAAVVWAGVRSPGVVAVVAIATAVAGSTVRQLLVTAPARTPVGLVRLVRGQRGYWGGQLAHLGVALAAVAIAVSGGLAQRATVSLDRGQSVAFAGYTVTFEVSEEHPEADRLVTDAHIVLRDGGPDGPVVRVAQPRLVAFPNQPTAVGNPSVWSTAGRDVYVTLGGLDPQRVTLNLYRYPLMVWLWVAGGLMMAGGLWALTGRVRRRAAPPSEPLAEVGSDA